MYACMLKETGWLHGEVAECVNKGVSSSSVGMVTVFARMHAVLKQIPV